MDYIVTGPVQENSVVQEVLLHCACSEYALLLAHTILWAFNSLHADIAQSRGKPLRRINLSRAINSEPRALAGKQQRCWGGILANLRL